MVFSEKIRLPFLKIFSPHMSGLIFSSFYDLLLGTKNEVLNRKYSPPENPKAFLIVKI